MSLPYMVRIEGDKYVFEIPYFLNHKAKDCGARFSRVKNLWTAKITNLTTAAILNNFDEDHIHPDIVARMPAKPEIPEITDMHLQAVIKQVELRPRQVEGLLQMWLNPSFALFWCMGAGKTLSTIAIMNNRRNLCGVDGVLILSPASVRGVWPKEINRYSALEYHVQIAESGKKIDKWQGFPVLVGSIESLSQGGGFDNLKGYLSQFKNPMLILDESSRIKNTGATRTKRAIELSYLSSYKVILTGTSITRGVEDLFSQMAFLDPSLIGEISYYSFRNKYCVMGGFQQSKVIGYRDVDKLIGKISHACDVVKQEEMTGLPDRNFQVRKVKVTKEQKNACIELKHEMETILNGKTVEVSNVLTYMLRAQQIAGGFDPEGNPIGSKNPKLAELLDIVEDYEGNVIIWSRFLPEVRAIKEAIAMRYGTESVDVIIGETDDVQDVADRFESGGFRFLVANPATGGIGLTLISASLAIYYSNSFNLEDRLQSEGRNYRIGSKWPVTYIDIASDIAIDNLILKSLANKKDVADFVSNGLKVSDII